MNKKGISPLISTLILIVFSIGLGAIVMSWGKVYIEERAEFVGQVSAAPLGCDTVNFNLWKVGGTAQYCAGGGKAKVLIENSPNSRFDNLEARLVGTTGVHTESSLLKESVSQPKGLQVEFNTGAIGAIKQIKLIPILMIDSELHYCTNKGLVIEEPIPSC